MKPLTMKIKEGDAPRVNKASDKSNITTITDKFNAPFGEVPGLRLQYVSRWNIISMDRKQSVAEHSYNVALIVRYLCEKKGRSEETTNSLVSEALLHDIEELYTGDIPSPAKTSSSKDGSVMKLADMIESYRYASMHCNDTDKVQVFVVKGLLQKIARMSSELGIPHDMIKPLVEDI